MSIKGKIKTLFSDKNKTEVLFPRTKVSAVSDDNGVGLNVLLEQTVPMTRGGTGAENGAEGLANLFAAGSTVLSPYQYGTELPANAAVGQVYFEEATGTIADIGQDVAKALRAVNLLDNSDFRNPVNQRGGIHYSGNNIYSIDRWVLWSETITPALSVIDGQVAFRGYVMQKLEIDMSKTYTFAALTSDGLLCLSGVPTSTIDVKNGNTGIGLGTDYTGENVQVAIYTVDGSVASTVVWAALYEGEYTAETLPPYVSKGYGVELAECQRYFRKVTAWETFAYGYVDWDSSLVAIMPINAPMRVKPSISGTWNITVIVNGEYIKVTTAPTETVNHSYGGIEIRWVAGAVSSEYRSRACGFKTSEGSFTLSADL